MIGIKIDHRATAKDYITDYLYGVAEDIVVEKYGKTLSEEENDKMIVWEHDGLIQFIKEKL